MVRNNGRFYLWAPFYTGHAPGGVKYPFLCLRSMWRKARATLNTVESSLPDFASALRILPLTISSSSALDAGRRFSSESTGAGDCRSLGGVWERQRQRKGQVL